MSQKTNVSQLLKDLDAGVFEQKIAHALSQVAAGVVDHGRAGRVQVTFDLKQIGESHQVACVHKLVFSQPTSKGKVSEENTTETPLYVNAGGELTLFPNNQARMFDKHGSPEKQA
jgi:hypothetical protein